MKEAMSFSRHEPELMQMFSTIHVKLNIFT